MILPPFKSFRTERLKLRKLKISDAPEILVLRSDDRVNQYIDRPKTTSIPEAEAFITKVNNSIKDNECYYWGVTLKNKDQIIGTICLWKFEKNERKAETGYELHPDHQQQGIMNEALSKVMDFAIGTVKLAAVEAVIDPDNTASARLLEKRNFLKHREEVSEDDNKKKLFVYILEPPKAVGLTDR